MNTIISVTCPYVMCTRLLTRYLYIIFMDILTLLACTHYVDNLFHTLMVLWENENFLTFNTSLFVHQPELVPSSYINFLNFDFKNIINNIFITIQCLFDPLLNLRVSSVVSPHSFSRSS